MPTALYVWCACGHVGTIIPIPPALDAMDRQGKLNSLRCSRCGERPNDLRIGWTMGELAGNWDATTAQGDPGQAEAE